MESISVDLCKTRSPPMLKKKGKRNKKERFVKHSEESVDDDDVTQRLAELGLNLLKDERNEMIEDNKHGEKT